MNNLVIIAIVGVILCGTAAGQRNDYAYCSSSSQCRNNCCLNATYCSPPVDGTCSSQNLAKVCENSQVATSRIFCSLISQVSKAIPQLASTERSAVLPTVLGVVTNLLGGVLNVLEFILPILGPLLQAVRLLLRGLDGGLDPLLNVLNNVLGNLLKGLLG